MSSSAKSGRSSGPPRRWRDSPPRESDRPRKPSSWVSGASCGLVRSVQVGLVTAIVLAWFYGERGHQRVMALEATLLGTIVVAGGFVTVLVARAPDDAIPGPVAARAAPIGLPPDERSLVVLPFADLSAGGGHEYLADGITWVRRSTVPPQSAHMESASLNPRRLQRDRKPTPWTIHKCRDGLILRTC